MSEERATKLYAFHTAIVWAGSIWQIIHTFTTKSVEDIAVWWIIALLVAQIIAIPLSFCSHFGIWKICRVGSAILCAILLIGVLLYGG